VPFSAHIGLATVQVQLRTVPPFMVAAVWALVNAYFSFRWKQRAAAVLISVLLSVAGYGIAVGTTNSHARYFTASFLVAMGADYLSLDRYAGCFLSVAGASPSAPVLLAWATDNSAPDTVRAVTTAIVPGMKDTPSFLMCISDAQHSRVWRHRCCHRVSCALLQGLEVNAETVQCLDIPPD
jgi:hypothetical protein